MLSNTVSYISKHWATFQYIELHLNVLSISKSRITMHSYWSRPPLIWTPMQLSLHYEATHQSTENHYNMFSNMLHTPLKILVMFWGHVREQLNRGHCCIALIVLQHEVGSGREGQSSSLKQVGPAQSEMKSAQWGKSPFSSLSVPNSGTHTGTLHCS